MVRLWSRRRKGRPTGITLVANCNWPISDLRSRKVRAWEEIALSRVWEYVCNLSWGRRACIATVSSSIPRNVNDVAGPSVLCCARGIARSLHNLMNVLRSRDARAKVG